MRVFDRSSPSGYFFLLAALAVSSVPNFLFAGIANAQGLEEIFLKPDLLSGRALQIFLLATIISISPAIAISATAFPFIITVLAIVRQAIGLQQSPPNMLLVILALFLTYYIMDPVLQEAWSAGGAPLVEGRISADIALLQVVHPFKDFMASRVDLPTIISFAELREIEIDHSVGSLSSLPFSILTPAFVVSELARAFEVGFLIFIPFLVIDLVVAAILMSMGMMMVPPAIVSLPFKLAFFVAADGWLVISEAVINGYL